MILVAYVYDACVLKRRSGHILIDKLINGRQTFEIFVVLYDFQHHPGATAATGNSLKCKNRKLLRRSDP